MGERENIENNLNKVKRALAILEEQAAGFGKLHIPSHLQIELEDKRNEVSKLEIRLRELPSEEINILQSQNPIEKEIYKEFYRNIAYKWAELARFDTWENWIDRFNMGYVDTPHYYMDDIINLENLYDWLYKRQWPEGILEEISKAFDNFRNVLRYFLKATASFMGPESKADSERFVLEKVWKYERLTQEEYDEASRLFISKRYILQELIIELLRAANYINFLIRQLGIDPLFRLDEGILTASIAIREELEYDKKKYIYPFVLPAEFNELLKIN